MNYEGKSILDLATSPQVEINRLDILANAADIAQNAADIAQNDAGITALQNYNNVQDADIQNNLELISLMQPEYAEFGLNVVGNNNSVYLQPQSIGIDKTGLTLPLFLNGCGINILPTDFFSQTFIRGLKFSFTYNNPADAPQGIRNDPPPSQRFGVTQYFVDLDLSVDLVGLTAPDLAIVELGCATSIGFTSDQPLLCTKILTFVDTNFRIHQRFKYSVDWSVHGPGSNIEFFPTISVSSPAAGAIGVFTRNSRDGVDLNRLRVQTYP